MGACCSKVHADRRVVIVGAGYVGTWLAKQIDSTFDVIVLERKDAFVHTFGQLRASVDSEYAGRSLIPYDGLLKRGTFKQATVTAIHTDRVELEGEADIAIRPGKDFLVIATGSSAPPPCRWTSRDADGIRVEQAAVRSAIDSAGKIVIVGGGPVGVELAGEIKAKHTSKHVTIVHRGPYLCSGKAGADKGEVVPEAFGARLQSICEDVGVEVRCSTAAEFDGDEPPAGLVPAPGDVRLSDGSAIEGVDLAIWVTGSRPNNAAFRTTLKDHLTEHGRLGVEDTLMLRSTDNVFAIGDCAESRTPQTAYHGRKQADLVAKSIAALASGASRDSLKPFDAGGPGLLVPIGPTRGSGSVVMCGGPVTFSDGFTSSIKGKDLFTSQTWSDLGLKGGDKA